MTESRDAHELIVVFPIDPDAWDKLGITAQRKLVSERFFEEATTKGLVVRYDGYTVHAETAIEGLRLFPEDEDGNPMPIWNYVRSTGWVIPNPGELDG